MNNRESNPPLWAEAMLRSLLRPSDRDSISGDLLEEYREARRPALGAPRANVWYIKHVLSVLWRLMWPCLLALTALTLLSYKFKALWYVALLNRGIVPAPLVSPANALVYLWAGYFASRRSGLVRTGAIVAGTTSLIGFVNHVHIFRDRSPGPPRGAIRQTVHLRHSGEAAVAGAGVQRCRRVHRWRHWSMVAQLPRREGACFMIHKAEAAIAERPGAERVLRRSAIPRP